MTVREEIPIEEAAQRLGATPLAVLMHIKQKRLKGTEIEGRWHVNAPDLAALCAEGAEDSPKPRMCGGGCSGCSSKG